MKKQTTKGFGIIEIIIAMSIMITIASTAVSAVLFGFTVNRTGAEETIANNLAQEGLEAVKSIRNQNWSNLVAGNYGLAISGGVWSFSGSSDSVGKYTRQVSLSAIDSNTYLATCSASWSSSVNRSNSVSLTSYLTNWRKGACNWSTATLKGSFDKAGTVNPNDIVIDGNYAYLISNNQGGGDPEFFIINISNPFSPTLAGSLEIGLDVTGVAVSGNFAYISTGGNSSEIITINISNKSTPSIISTLNLGANQDAKDIFVSGNYAYVGKVNGSGSNRELYIIDISNPNAPSLTGTYEVGADVNAVFVSGNYAYLATSDSNKELEIINITNKSSPTQAGTFNAAGAAAGLAINVSGNTAYLGRASSGSPDLLILNVANPSSISQTGSFEAGGAVYEIQVNSNDAYFVSDNSTKQFQVLDISNPSSPTLKTSLNLSGAASGLAYSSTNCTAYVSSSVNNQELQIIQP